MLGLTQVKHPWRDTTYNSGDKIVSALSTRSMAVEIEGVLLKENVNNVKKWSKMLFFPLSSLFPVLISPQRFPAKYRNFKNSTARAKNRVTNWHLSCLVFFFFFNSLRATFLKNDILGRFRIWDKSSKILKKIAIQISELSQGHYFDIKIPWVLGFELRLLWGVLAIKMELLGFIAEYLKEH